MGRPPPTSQSEAIPTATSNDPNVMAPIPQGKEWMAGSFTTSRVSPAQTTSRTGSTTANSAPYNNLPTPDFVIST